MTNVVIAQNIFIGVVLSVLLDFSKSKSKKVVILSSEIERSIFQLIFPQLSRRINVLSIIPNYNKVKAGTKNKQLRDSIEYKRKTIKEKRLSNLSSNLVLLLDDIENKTSGDVEYWIYNRWTWIAQTLRTIGKNKNTVVFESANFDGGICAFGNLDYENGNHIRHKLDEAIDHDALEKYSRNIKWLKKFRLVSHLISMFMNGIKLYYLKRMIIRVTNLTILKFVHTTPLNKNPDPSQDNILVILQIEKDSEILRYGTEQDYRNLLINCIKKKRTSDSVIYLRPHPKDFTIGWLHVFWAARLLTKNIYLSLGTQDELNLENFSHIITYSSNFTRRVYEDNAQHKLTIIKNAPSLLNVDIEPYVYLRGLL